MGHLTVTEHLAAREAEATARGAFGPAIVTPSKRNRAFCKLADAVAVFTSVPVPDVPPAQLSVVARLSTTAPEIGAVARIVNSTVRTLAMSGGYRNMASTLAPRMRSPMDGTGTGGWGKDVWTSAECGAWARDPVAHELACA